jgi:hypothetical protein
VRLLSGHSGPVTCLLYPHEEHPRYEPHHLLSGGADFAVFLWDLNSGARIHRFCVQAGPILRMLIPPDNCNVITNCRGVELMPSVCRRGFCKRCARWRRITRWRCSVSRKPSAFSWRVAISSPSRRSAGVRSTTFSSYAATMTPCTYGKWRPVSQSLVFSVSISVFQRISTALSADCWPTKCWLRAKNRLACPKAKTKRVHRRQCRQVHAYDACSVFAGPLEKENYSFIV